MINMKCSLAGMIEIAGHEGISLTKYRDSANVWTIGIGMTATEIPDLAVWPLNKALTMQQCFDMFAAALINYETPLNKALINEIPQYQFDALVSWAYNVGIGWIAKASIIQALNNKAPSSTLYADLMLYNKPSEIIKRRTKEAILLTTGKYSNNGLAQLLPQGGEIDVSKYFNTPPLTTSASSVNDISAFEKIKLFLKTPLF